VNRLTIDIETGTSNYPQVRLLVDGDDLLVSSGDNRGSDPADILDTGTLLPTIRLDGSPSTAADAVSSDAPTWQASSSGATTSSIGPTSVPSPGSTRHFQTPKTDRILLLRKI
jgi:hypothetical protein